MASWLVETTLVAGILAVLALGIGRLLPRSPTVRHALWVLVLVKLITPPLAAWPWARCWQVPTWFPARDPVNCDILRLPADDITPESLAEPLPLDFKLDPGEITALLAQVDQAGTSEPKTSEPKENDRPEAGGLARIAIGGWLLGGLVLALWRGVQIMRFRRFLAWGRPAPEALVREAEALGQELGVRAPMLLAIPGLPSPVLWCLGRPRLLLPERLLDSLPPDRWPAILVHELAHLKRGDHWVRRLDLFASLFWWWHPLYWLTRARLETESELACDAWVISTRPANRFAYAQVLYQICESLAAPGSPAPALGVAGQGRFVERRLNMILNENVRHRVSPWGALGIALLFLVSIPSWMTAKADEAATVSSPAPAAIAQDGDKTSAKPAKHQDVDQADAAASKDDEDNDAGKDSAGAAHARALERELKAVERQQRALEAALKKLARAQERLAREQAEPRAEPKAEPSTRGGSKSRPRSEVKVEVKGTPGQELAAKLEKEMQALSAKLGKEMEAKFGPGSDFEKAMQKLGKELEAKLGEGSEFEAKMKDLARELESKLGEGSEFEARMKKLGKELETKLNKELKARHQDDADTRESVKEAEKRPQDEKALAESKAAEMRTRAEARRAEIEKARDLARAKHLALAKHDKLLAAARQKAREERIRRVETEINRLQKELERLRREGDDHTDPDPANGGKK